MSTLFFDDADDVREGSVIWLGSWEDTLKSHQRRGTDRRTPVTYLLDSRRAPRYIYGHPALVVGLVAGNDNRIAFLQMTSFGSSETLKQSPKRYMPITPAPDHPYFVRGLQEYATLTLENGDAMMKPTWVDFSRVYLMDKRDAQYYYGEDPSVRRPRTLDIASLHRLQALVHIKLAKLSLPIPLPQNVSVASSSTVVAPPQVMIGVAGASRSPPSESTVGIVPTRSGANDETQPLLPGSHPGQIPASGQAKVAFCESLWRWAKRAATDTMRSFIFLIRLIGRLHRQRTA